MNSRFFKVIICTLFIVSCNQLEKDNRTDDEIISLIEQHKEDIVFMSFWSNINDRDFKKVLEFETKQGNLENNKFILKIPTDESFSEFTEVPFAIKNNGEEINLQYEDEVWIKSTTYSLPIKDGSYKEPFYRSIENYLNNHFDEKYETIHKSFISNTWKISDTTKKERIINMSSIVTIFKDDFSQVKFFKRDEKAGRDRIAYCKINIRYLLMEDYMKNFKNKSGNDSIEIKPLIRKEDIAKHNNIL